MANILVVHQDPLQSYLLTMLLDSPQDTILSSCSLEEALTVCDDRDDIDGVVLDLQALNGAVSQFSQQRQWSPYQTIPTLAISSHYSDCEAERICEEYHVDGYLALPVKPQRFRQFVRDLIQQNIASAALC